MTIFGESTVEQVALAWLQGLGRQVAGGARKWRPMRRSVMTFGQTVCLRVRLVARSNFGRCVWDPAESIRGGG